MHLGIFALAPAALLWVLISAMIPSRIAVGFGLVLWSLNLSWITSPDVALMAAFLGMLTIASAAFGHSRSTVSSAQPIMSSRAPVLTYLPIVVGSLGLLLSFFAYAPSDVALVSTGLIAMGVLTIVTVRAIGGEATADAAYGAITVVMLLSLATLALGVGQTNYSARAQGIFTNPNTLGVSAGLWCVLSLNRKRSWIAVVPLSLFMIAQSGSRGAMLSTVVALGGWLWGSRATTLHRSRTAVYLVRGLLILVFLGSFRQAIEFYETPDHIGSESGVLRESTSNRPELAHVAWTRIQERPITGWGLGLEQVDGVSHPHILPLTLTFQLGIAGLLLSVCVIVLLVRGMASGVPGVVPLVIFSIVDMVAESWMFGPGSFVAWIFWFSLSGLLASADLSTAEQWREGRAPPQDVHSK